MRTQCILVPFALLASACGSPRGAPSLTTDARVACSTNSHAYLDAHGCERSATIPILPGRSVIEIVVPHLWLAAGEYYITATVFPNLNVVSCNQYFDVQWKRWAVCVYREGMMQNTILEQPVEYVSSSLASSRSA